MPTSTLIQSNPNRSFSSSPDFSTSHGDAAQLLAERSEPKSERTVEAAGATKINRRALMNMFVSAAVVANAAPVMATAATAPSEPVINDAVDGKLFALVDELIALERRYSDLCSAADRAKNHVTLPEALRVRPRDLELGRTLFNATDEHWHRPCDIGQWRNVMEYKSEMIETDDRMEIVTWKIQPTEELRERGTEISTAFDGWYNKKPRGYKKMMRELKRVERAYTQLEWEVANTPATTLEGMRAKVRCADAYDRRDVESISGGCAEAMAISIFKDVRRMTEGSPPVSGAVVETAPSIAREVNEPRHPVYGDAAFANLAALPLSQLNDWHAYATTAEESRFQIIGPEAADTDVTYDAIYTARWDIFEAAFRSPVRNSDDLARLMELVERHGRTFGDEDETPITRTRLQHLAKVAREVAE
jgi:hypothetical protein